MKVDELELTKSEEELKKASAGLDFFGTNEMHQKTLQQLPASKDDLLSVWLKREAQASLRPPPVPKRKKTVTFSKNLELPEPKDKMPGLAEEKYVDVTKSKSQVAPTDQLSVPSVLHKEPTGLQQEPSVCLAPSTFVRVQQVSEKHPSVTPQLPDHKHNKRVTFAKDTKFEKTGRKATSHVLKVAPATKQETVHTEPSKIAVPTAKVTLPSNLAAMPTQDISISSTKAPAGKGFMPTPAASVQIAAATETDAGHLVQIASATVPTAGPAVTEPTLRAVEPTVFSNEPILASSEQAIGLSAPTAGIHVPTTGATGQSVHIPMQTGQKSTSIGQQNALTQEEVFNLLSKCIPPRPPPSIIART